MTVIACSLREMAADRLCHEDDSSHYFCKKILRLDDGSIVGGAGNKPEVLIDWLQRGANVRDKPEIVVKRDDFYVLQLRPDGIWLYVNSTIPYKLEARNYAVGCGGDVALYAMRVLKKSPTVACREAIKINKFCGGKVDTMFLTTKRS